MCDVICCGDEHHLKTSHTISRDSTTCVTYSTDYNYQCVTLESRFTKLNLKQLNCPKSLSTSSSTLKTIIQQETATHCLLFILQPIYLLNQSLHTSSQSNTSCVYQQLLHLLTNQTAHQSFSTD